MSTLFKNSNVVLTGANGMLGTAVARQLAMQGARLALLVREPEKCTPLLDELKNLGATRTILIKCDLTQAHCTDAAIAEAAHQLGSIDVLIAAAGAAQGGLFWEIDDAAWQRNLEVKLFGTIRTLRAVSPFMIAQRKGRIVVIVGNSAAQPEPRMLPGAAANAALLAIIRGLAKELGPHGVVINAVNPGPVHSPRWQNLMQATATREGISTAEAEQKFISRSSLRRLATAEEVAQHVLYLASPLTAHITGSSLTVDGGSSSY